MRAALDKKRFGPWALVTGASKGLGAAFAEALAQRGMNLVLVARSTGELNALSTRLYAKYKVQRTVISIDLADPSSPRKIAEELHLSVKTVESYQAHIKQKLNLPTARALVQRAIEWRISTGESPV